MRNIILMIVLTTLAVIPAMGDFIELKMFRDG